MDYTTQQIVDHLRIAVNLETELYGIRQVNSDLYSARFDLISRYPSSPEYENEVVDTDGYISRGATIGFIVGGIIGVAYEWFLESSRVGSIGDGLAFFGACIVLGLFFGAIGAFIGVLGGGISKNVVLSKVVKRNEEKKQEIEKEFTEKQKEKERLLAVFNDEIEKNNELIATYNSMLQKHYSEGLLYKTYQTLPAVCKLLEYFESGRFKSLGDAYNQYELEAGLNNIATSISSLHELINYGIDRLSAGQRELYDRLSSIQENVGSIKRYSEQFSKSLDQISFSSAMQAYYSEKTAEATSLLAEMELYEKRYSLPASAQGIEESVKALRKKLI